MNIIINLIIIMKKYIQSFVSQYLLTILLAAGLFVMLGALNGGVHAALQGTCTLRGGAAAVATDINHFPACSEIDAGSLGFQIPTLGDILTFAVRAFFAIAGLAALFYMLLGAFGWVTSGGDKDAIAAAREKIQAAVVGMILVVAVLAVIWTLEQVIFKRRICLGLSCSVTLPGLIESKGEGYCCVCAAEGTGTLVDIINTGEYKCQADGVGIAR
jgi:hypothetical protein